MSDMVGGGEESGAVQDTTDYASIWQTYSGWVAAEDQWLTEETARTKASMAAGGVRPDTIGWEQGLQAVRREYDQRITELQGTETYRILSSNPAVGGGNMSAYYEAQYGKSGPSSAGGTAEPGAKPRATPDATVSSTLGTVFPWLQGSPDEGTLWMNESRGGAGS